MYESSNRKWEQSGLCDSLKRLGEQDGLEDGLQRSGEQLCLQRVHVKFKSVRVKNR